MSQEVYDIRCSEYNVYRVEINAHYCKVCRKLIGVDRPVGGSAKEPIRAHPFHICPNCESIYCSLKCMKPAVDFTYADEHKISRKKVRNECIAYLKASIQDDRDDCGCLNHIDPNESVLHCLRCIECAKS